MKLRHWCASVLGQIGTDSLGRRLLAAILVCSTVLALAATGFQLFVEFRRDVSLIDERMQAIEASYLDSLAISVWHFDQTAIRSQLSGVARLQDIRSVVVYSEEGDVIAQAGSPLEADAPIRGDFPLMFRGRADPVRVGSLTVTASFEDIYRRLADRVLIILATQSVKTFVVAILILMIFHSMVSKPLKALADYARTLKLERLDEPLVLHGRRPRREPDEFDVLVTAINEMRDSIRRDVDALNHMQKDLARSEERYRSLLESTNVVPWEADADSWTFSFIGPQAEGLLGYTREDWQRPGFWRERLSPEDAAGLRKHMRGRSGQFECECRLRDAAGKDRWVWIQAAVRSVGDRPALMQGYLLDIDARKRIEAELARYREGLEALVDQRTAELALQVQRLEDTQHQLLQSEKMASIGQLAAGVAHEINNPMGFITANLHTMRRYWLDVTTVLRAYRQCEKYLPEASAEARALNSTKLGADIDYLMDDIPQLIDESVDGAARITKIVTDLRDFSHPDKDEPWTFADLHQGIDSTLNIVNNQIKYKADVVKDYGALPQVECLPSQLNQVFMNLLVNAGHAIKKRGTITIRTRIEGAGVQVEVADTGEGIRPENISRIFNPFFTTKPIGKGTGLGLSLAYGIIERHRGKIEVASVPGEGTTFSIWLPIIQETPVAAGQVQGQAH